jgi:hypothetical protein
VSEKDCLLSDESKLRAEHPVETFPESTAGAQIERLKQEVESLRAENAALRRMKVPGRRLWGGFVFKYLVLAALISVAVFSSMSRNQTIENVFDQIGRALR